MPVSICCHHRMYLLLSVIERACVCVCVRTCVSVRACLCPSHIRQEQALKHKAKLWWKTTTHIHTCNKQTKTITKSFFCCVLVWLDQNKSRIQTNKSSKLYILSFEVIFIRLQHFGHVVMMGAIFIYILSTISFNIFIKTIEQIMKIITHLTTATNGTCYFVTW